jgi:branched-subunit amino acid transport protein
MTPAWTWWIVILVVGALNYLSRLSFIALFAHIEMPPLAARALRFVPSTMLTAIVIPAVVFTAPATLVFSYTNPKLVAALVAALIAWRLRSATATMAGGMVALWIAQWVVRGAG